LLLANQGKGVLRKLLKLQTTVEDTGSITTEEGKQKGEDKRPAWMTHLKTQADTWLKAIPSSVQLLERTAENIKNPLFRYFEREMTSASKLLKRVRNDLNELIQVCDGAQKQTNNTRSLISSLSKGKKN
jgi:dynein heavy chain 1